MLIMLLMLLRGCDITTSATTAYNAISANARSRDATNVTTANKATMQQCL